MGTGDVWIPSIRWSAGRKGAGDKELTLHYGVTWRIEVQLVISEAKLHFKGTKE